MFLSDPTSLMRVVIVGALAYAALIAVLRVSGKRTLAKLNAFDLVVTVALGSLLATVLISKDVALLEGLLAFATLVALQYGIAWGSRRSTLVARLAKARPQAVVIDGMVREEVLRAERLTRDEVLAAVRGSGHGDLSGVAAVVLETDGSLSVIPVERKGDGSALAEIL